MAPEGYPSSAAPPEDCIMQGYLLKKKRKKMQGMARRYFYLTSTGTLSYAFNTHSPIRDSISVNLAYISANRKTRSIHIDSGKTVYHCKALTSADFDKWVKAYKEVNDTLQERDGGSNAAKSPSGSSLGGGFPSSNQGIDAAVKRMAQPLQELESILNDFRGQSPSSLGTPNNVNQKITSPGALSPNSGGYSSGHSLKSKLGLGTGRHRSASKSVSDDHSYFDAKASTNEALVTRYATALGTLKAQYEYLSSQFAGAGAFETATKSYASRQSIYSSYGEASVSSINSGGDEDFYDAPGDFVLDEMEGSSSEEEASIEDSSFTSLDEGVEEEEDDKSPPPASRQSSATSRSEIKDVQRRSQLSVPQGQEFSMLSLLRKNVGKDLSTISFPVSTNEPLSALQRIAEEFEYTDLLDKAAATEDSIERLALVTVFAISGNAGNKYRASRKPFNPLLGETYECVRPDKGFKFVAEKLSHRPPVLGFHSEAKKWQIDGYLAPDQKFWGRCMEILVSGEFVITFKDTEDRYTIKKPSSFVRNLMAGTKYIEVVGTMTVTNENTGESATVEFKEGSAWGGSSTRNKLVAQIKDANGQSQMELVGRWDEEVSRKNGKDEFTRLWSIKDFPNNPEKYYGFSKFASSLNEITEVEKDRMAPTDSRLRPDQRQMEEGNIEEAEQSKKRVEEKQRAKRIELEQKGGDAPVPKWFTKQGSGWKYTGEYFKVRDEKKFEDPDIF
ncbi:BQ5605_C007g04800 [Microbotryum silenes-dioicae]|uniref:BQ5605_C007g04800 protein n=1 Tax=Microbotryum silenes-dioicae TaxID=796604 RepID=A0A2X0M818_9BASI|nr:BQ5605_C007g04800 [Microbotryum silenes-dioicae]